MKKQNKQKKKKLKLKKHICKYCGVETIHPDDECYKATEIITDKRFN